MSSNYPSFRQKKERCPPRTLGSLGGLKTLLYFENNVFMFSLDAISLPVFSEFFLKQQKWKRFCQVMKGYVSLWDL